MLNNQKEQLTKQVLKSISYHLSSRTDCKDKEYEVTIYSDGEKDAIAVSPYITVFPGIHDRKESDRRGIAYHAVYHHFPEIYLDATNVIVHVPSNSLVHGTYVYKKYECTRRRKWVRK